MVSLLIGVIIIYNHIMDGLPNVQDLKSVKLPLPMRIYTQEGELMAEFGARRQQFVKIDTVPPLLLKAFFAIEDQRFWVHRGVDVYALLRASLELLTTGQKSQGGSTITMQVARNFYLTREKTFLRKLKEIILALKIERELSKHQIMELYLNKIYMGNRTFGVCSAAQLYFKKKLDELNVAEIALLAGLPKSPALVNPIINPEAAKKRRDVVLARMYHLNLIKKTDYHHALEYPVNTPSYDALVVSLLAPYAADMAREEVHRRFGMQSDMEGYHVYTTINAAMQRAGEKAVKSTLFDYDKQEGYRGAEKFIGSLTIDNFSYLLDQLNKTPVIHGLLPAVIIEQDQTNMTVLLATGLPINISRVGWEWILKREHKVLNAYLKPGDLIRVEQKDGQWYLSQLPEVEAALVALDPQDGAVKTLVGGFDYRRSQFNRAVYATRQPGSAFKPFIYAAALAKGYTLADVFNDAPLVFDRPGQSMPWRPNNVTQSFKGLTRLRIGLVYSINLVTVRILQAVGITDALNYIEKFGFDTKKLPRNLSLALGSGEVSPLAIAKGYAVFANGGYGITPYLINHITDAQGHLIYQAQPQSVYTRSSEELTQHSSTDKLTTLSPHRYAPRVISPEVAFLINSALQDVTRYGTGQAVQRLNRIDLAGKTGTTNDRIDNWFVLYNRYLVSNVWVGFDQPRPLKKEAYPVALPLSLRFMGEVLQTIPEEDFAQPSTLEVFPINPLTGERVSKNTSDTIDEYFQISENKKKNFFPLLRNPSQNASLEPLF